MTIQVASGHQVAPDGGNDFSTSEAEHVDEKPFSSVSLRIRRPRADAGYTRDAKVLYWLDSRGRDTAALVAMDVASGATRVIAESTKADVGSVLTDPHTGKVQAYEVEYLKSEWSVIDPAVNGDLNFLKSRLTGKVNVTSRTEADDFWTVAVDPVTAPSATYLYDRKGKTLTKLFVSRPQLEGATLAAMHPEEIRTRDGGTEVSYLSLLRPVPIPMATVVLSGHCPWCSSFTEVRGPATRTATTVIISACGIRLRRAGGELPRLDGVRQELHLGRRPAMGRQDA
jgi:hypothetical protein